MRSGVVYLMEEMFPYPKWGTYRILAIAAALVSNWSAGTAAMARGVVRLPSEWAPFLNFRRFCGFEACQTR